ncbi:FtsX-like permease family protein [Demequina sp. NBRC 110055]|uniref:FtsX-like permease family protein n=1 Tax=Demequina sp. NBRC 110055 TaxID=1570344 RepID=UPI000A0743DE|nr:FtsX-like permease family protein [Demequina sp. NBRC 110055]
MIGVLLREQLRAQRAALAWMTMLIAAAAGFATYSWTANLTDDALAAQGAILQGRGELWDQSAVVEDHSNDELASGWGTPMTRDEIDAFVAQANAEGAGLVATETVYDAWTAPEGDADAGWGALAQAFSGDVLWHEGLAEGDAPGAGEVAIPANVAAAWGVGIGDRVEVGYDAASDTGDYHAVGAGTRVVSGIVVDRVNWGTDWVGETPTAFSPGDPLLAASFEASPDYAWEGGKFAQMEFAWERDTPATIAAFPDHGWTWATGGPQASGATVLAAVLAVGTVIAAVAVGRSQAQRRARWTATARALGASRSSIAAATLAEGSLVGLIGGTLGLGAGLAVAQAHLQGVLDAAAAPPDVTLAVPATTYLTAVGGGIVLGLVITAIPAALAARVTPASALKDVAAVDEAELTRRVRVWPVAVITAVGYIGMGVSAAFYQRSGDGWLLVFGGITLVSGFALLVEGSRRWAGWLGGWLSRRSSPAAVRAGLDLLAHPRQAAALTLLQCVTLGVIVAMSTISTLTDTSPGSGSFGWFAYAPNGESFPLRWDVISIWMVQSAVSWRLSLGVLIALQALAGAIIAGSRGLAAVEEGAARALGLNARAARWAEVLRFTLPQAVGAAAGATLALAAAVPFVWVGAQEMYYTGHGVTLVDVADAALLAALVATLAWAVIAAGAAVAWAVRAVKTGLRRETARIGDEVTR